ncbi:hypothetical protein SHIRM173S_08565 [Streptomyces hirsutus]
MSPDPETGSSWSTTADATHMPPPHARQDDRAAAGEPFDFTTTSGEAFVITGLPGPPPGDTAVSPTAPGPLDDQPDEHRTGLWDRLGDRMATAVTAAAAGLVLLGVLFVMSMITDGITFTSDKTQPAGENTSIVNPPGQNTQPEGSATPAAPPITAAPSPSDLPTDPETGISVPPGDGKEDDHDEAEEDEEDDHDEEEDEDDDEDH